MAIAALFGTKKRLQFNRINKIPGLPAGATLKAAPRSTQVCYLGG